MLDKEVDEEGWVEGGLPPKFMKGFEDVWMDGCGGEDTELARAAFYQFTSRDEDTLMVRSGGVVYGIVEQQLLTAYSQYIPSVPSRHRYHSTTCATTATTQKN